MHHYQTENFKQFTIDLFNQVTLGEMKSDLKEVLMAPIRPPINAIVVAYLKAINKWNLPIK